VFEIELRDVTLRIRERGRTNRMEKTGETLDSQETRGETEREERERKQEREREKKKRKKEKIIRKEEGRDIQQGVAHR
jgi:hypothetical protein